MKLVYLIAGTFNSGGMERVLTSKANWFAAHGHEVVVVTTDQRGQKPYFQLDGRIKTYDLGINYDETNGSLLRKMLTFPVKQWRHQRRLTALLKQMKADVVICMFNNDVSFVHKIQDGSRKILEIHFSKNKKMQYGRHGLWALADRWRTLQEKKLVRKYDRFVVLTHEDATLWGNLPNMVVIPNSGPTPLLLPSMEGSRYLSKQVLAIGRLDFQKGFDTLLNIWHRLGKKDGWTLDIIGDGPLRPVLQEQVQRLGLQESVRLLKPTSHVQNAYLSASIFVLTSRYEGLPMVLLEAQACGLPIVAFTCQCGPRDIIEDGVNGYLIDNRDEAQFAQRLTTLMADSFLRQHMGKAALQSSERFTEENIMRRWLEVFKS